MSVKIFGGVAKGFPLVAPDSEKVRPTSIQLRRKLFDSVQVMEGVTFIDLCCGTGAMGLEALSRGVDHLVLVDKDVRFIRKNIQRLKTKYELLVEIEVWKDDAIRWMERNRERLALIQPVIFFDPPYEKVQMYEKFFEFPLSHLSFMCIIEACEQKTMPIKAFCEKFGEPQKIFTQGTSYFLLYYFGVQ